MNKKQDEIIPAVVEAPKPRKPEKVYLTNKAGAFANPLAKDFDAWAAIGWFKV
jgi:hypothetical protein